MKRKSDAKEEVEFSTEGSSSKPKDSGKGKGKMDEKDSKKDGKKTKEEAERKLLEDMMKSDPPEADEDSGKATFSRPSCRIKQGIHQK